MNLAPVRSFVAQWFAENPYALVPYLYFRCFRVCRRATGLGATCDRACLKSSLDQYLQAILKHDPRAAPLFLGYRHTENALLVKLGEGAWKSVTSIGKVDRRYYDPVSGQAAFFGVLNEGAEPMVTTVRIRVEDRKITEAEWIIARRVAAGINGFDAQGKPQAYAFSPDNLALHPIEQRVGAARAASLARRTHRHHQQLLRRHHRA